MAASLAALASLAATPLCVCVCVFVCLCGCVRFCVSLSCYCRIFRNAPTVPFRFSLIFSLPRPALGVFQPGLRGGPRRRLVGAKETRRGPPGKALAG